ncbi:MAG: hypothetical protein R3F05_03640 [Planctomycetota bacterium]
MRSRRFLQGAVFALGVATFAGCGGGGGGFRSETTDFFFTGQQETFTVPSGVTRLRIVAGGASGGHTTAFDGGHGALVDATVDVTPGEVLTILVGEQPALRPSAMTAAARVVAEARSGPWHDHPRHDAHRRGRRRRRRRRLREL